MRGLIAALCLCAAPVAAQDFLLGWPLDCTLGETCHIQQFSDHDPGPEARDFTCGPLSYDQHDGTDIALPTLADQAAGVDVLAAAAGTVTGIRDEMADALQGRPDAPDVTGVECGNGVVIRHDGGWETQYCHMARGSIRVAAGDQVNTGEVLGLVGLSGQTEFPHLHIAVRQNGNSVDPFAPANMATCGSAPQTNLWNDPVPYAAGGLLDIGFSDRLPDYEEVQAGTADRVLTRSSDALVLWGFIFGGQAGDTVELLITGPEGEVIRHQEPLDRTQARLFRAAGLRTPTGGWPAGDYLGTIRLIRAGAEVDRLSQTIGLD